MRGVETILHCPSAPADNIRIGDVKVEHYDHISRPVIRLLGSIRCMNLELGSRMPLGKFVEDHREFIIEKLARTTKGKVVVVLNTEFISNSGELRNAVTDFQGSIP